MNVNVQPKKGECEVCENKDVTITCHYGNMWFCDDCWAKEEAVSQETKETVVTENKLQNSVIETSRVLDNSIQVRTDLFNAATTAILDIKKAIDENSEIANKPYALAEELLTRFNHFKAVIFSAQEQIIDAGNHQKAIQVYLNQLANSLRQEEREKLRIQDINYKPAVVKPTVKRVSTSQTRKSTKLNKAELRKYAAELGVAEFTLQMLVVSKGITVEEAARQLKKSLEEARALK